MSDPFRPRRSVLYMPGSNPRALDKARSLPADVLILDLEDAVAPDEKVQARKLVVDAVSARGFGAREVVVRINALDTSWGHDDLAAAAAAGPDAVLLPKVNTAEDLLGCEAEIGNAKIALWAMMETPMGMLNAAQIAASTPRLACLVMGTNDLLKELGGQVSPGRTALMSGLGLCLLAARANGLSCIDGVYNAFRDEEGLRAECLQGRDMGFDGKTLIHPAQLATANAVFAPTQDALDEARAQLAAWETAVAEGRGVAVLNGRIVENLHVESARRLIALDKAIQAFETQNETR